MNKDNKLQRNSFMKVVISLSLVFVLTPNFDRAFAQVSIYTDTVNTGAWNANRWSTVEGGPYTGSYGTTANNAVFSTGTYSFGGAGSGTVPVVGNITLGVNTTVQFTTNLGTMDFGGAVRTITVGAGSLLDFNGQAVSQAAGTGLIKTGAGVFATGGGNGFPGGFTLSEGTVVARSVNGLGSGGGNTLRLNGGTIASAANTSFSASKFGGGITIGGDVQFGALTSAVPIALNDANLSFASAVNTGAVRRVLTQGNQGSQTFSGVISGSGGLTFAALSGLTSGRFNLSGANTFTGGISITGGDVRITQESALGNIANNIEIDGGLLSYELASAPLTISASHQITVGDGNGSANTGIMVRDTAGALATVNYNGVIANKSGETGILHKIGLGILTLGGTSTYTGATTVKGGTLLVSTGGSIAQSSLTTVTTNTILTANGTVGAVTVNIGGTLNGAGTVGTTTVAGTLNPGNSPGVLSVNGNLTMASGGNMVWELFTNTATQASPVAVFDQVLVSGDLAFAGNNGITLNFGAAGSDVAWSNSFWGSNQSFLIYDVAGSTTGLSNLSLLNTSFNDATGAALDPLKGRFSLGQSGSDVFLNYTAIPEPSTGSMLGLGFAGLVATRLLRRKSS